MVTMSFTPFGKLIGSLEKFVQFRLDEKSRVNLNWPEPVPGLSSQPQFFLPSDCFREDRFRTRVVPSIQDYSLAQRELFRGVETGSVEKEGAILARDVSILSKMPLKGFISYVKPRTRSSQQLEPVSAELPFDISYHPSSATHVGQAILDRLRAECNSFAESENNRLTYCLGQLFESDVKQYVSSPECPELSTTVSQVGKLLDELRARQVADETYVASAISTVLTMVNSNGHQDVKVDPCELGTDPLERPLTSSTNPMKDYSPVSWEAFLCARHGGKEVQIRFEYLVAVLLSSRSVHDLQNINPFLTPDLIAAVFDLTVHIMFHVNRIGQVIRCIDQGSKLLSMLTGLSQKVSAMQSLDAGARVRAKDLLSSSIALQAAALSNELMCSRFFVGPPSDESPVGSALVYDPRFLVFEFIYNIVLRKSQVELIHTFIVALKEGRSPVHQMIMGAGKTTVVGPLLALLLADGNTLVTQVCPSALLDFSRSVLRSRFSAIIHKPIYTFSFDRFSPVPMDLYKKLVKAKERRAVLITTPTAIKSFFSKICRMFTYPG